MSNQSSLKTSDASTIRNNLLILGTLHNVAKIHKYHLCNLPSSPWRPIALSINPWMIFSHHPPPLPFPPYQVVRSLHLQVNLPLCLPAVLVQVGGENHPTQSLPSPAPIARKQKQRYRHTRHEFLHLWGVKSDDAYSVMALGLHADDAPIE